MVPTAVALQVRKFEECIHAIFGSAWEEKLALPLKHWSSLMNKHLRAGLNKIDWERVQQIIQGLGEDKQLSIPSPNPEKMDEADSIVEPLIKNKMD